MKRLLAASAVLLFLAATAAGGTAWWAWMRWNASGPTEEVTRIHVPRGAGLQRITTILAQNGLLAAPADRLLFPLGVTLSGQANALRAGEYDIPAGAGMAEVASMLAEGRGIVQRPFTVAEGLTTPEVLALLRDVPHLEGTVTVQAETGDLLPETYHYVRGDSRDALVRRMKAAMDEALDALWKTRADGLPLRSPDEAVVLASIVEKETAVPEERPRIAAVFLNRLKRGMRLQSDPTVIYGLAPETGELDRPLTRADLEADHPWNTYAIDGLPPTPIANPGRDSLAAVLNPADTDDLYFVADGTGGHAFARTLREHNRNVDAWRRLQRERKAKAEQ